MENGIGSQDGAGPKAEEELLTLEILAKLLVPVSLFFIKLAEKEFQ